MVIFHSCVTVYQRVLPLLISTDPRHGTRFSIVMLNYQRLSPFIAGWFFQRRRCLLTLAQVDLDSANTSTTWGILSLKDTARCFFLSGDGWFIGWSEAPVWWLRMAAWARWPHCPENIRSSPQRLHHSVLVLKILRSRKTRVGKRVQL